MLQRNIGKLQLLLELGTSSGQQYAKFRERLTQHGAGKAFTVAAKHLGGWHALHVASPHEINYRIDKANMAWHSFHRFWNATAISLHWRLEVFRGVVF